MSEFRRVFNYKKIIMLVILVLINLGLYAYINVPESKRELSERQIYVHQKYIEEYHDSVTAVIANADNLKKFSVFSKKSTYTYSNIIRTANDFKRVENVNVSDDNSRAVEAFTGYYYSYYISFFFLIVIIYDLFKYRENGMWQITYSTKEGRDYTALTNIVIIAVSGLVTVFLMAASTFACSLFLYGGASDLKNPVQNMSSFAKFTYPVSKLQYVVILIAAAGVMTVMLGLLIWSVFMMFRQRNYALVCIAVFVGVEYVLYNKIETNNALNVLHFVNVINALQLNEMLRIYMNWGFGEFVFSVSSVVFIITFVITIVFTGAAVMRYGSMYPSGKVTLWDRCAAVIGRGYQRVLARMPQTLKEMHKLIFSGHGVWFVALTILVVVYSSTNGLMTYTDEQLLKDKMYIEHGGQDKDYIREYTDEWFSKMQQVQQQMSELMAVKNTEEAGDNWYDRYYELKGEYDYVKSKAVFCTEFSDKLAYIDDVNEQYGIDVWIISERGYSEIAGSGSTMRETMILIALVIAVMFITSENIGIEYSTGMELLLNGSRNGRSRRRIKKYISALVCSILICCIVYGIEYVYLNNAYGMPYLNAPALSLQCIYEKLGHGIYALPVIKNMLLNISIAGYLVFRTILEIFAVLIAMNVGILIGYMSKGKLNRAFQVVSVVVMIVAVVYIRMKIVF